MKSSFALSVIDGKLCVVGRPFPAPVANHAATRNWLLVLLARFRSVTLRRSGRGCAEAYLIVDDMMPGGHVL